MDAKTVSESLMQIRVFSLKESSHKSLNSCLKSNCTVESSRRHHLNQVFKVNISNTGTISSTSSSEALRRITSHFSHITSVAFLSKCKT